MNSLISIVVPVYNTSKYLRRCIDSITAQTYENTEIILVDDGSTDTSPQICEEYSKKDARITAVHRENGGLSAARNTGIDVSHGEYICFIDSDDFIHPEFIKTLYNMCCEYDADIAQCGFVTTSSDEFADDGKEFRVSTYSNIEMLRRIYQKSYTENIVAWNKLYKKALFADVRYPEGLMREDEATTFNLLYKAQKTAVTEKGYYYYYTNPDSFTRSKYTLKQLDIIRAIEIRLDFYRRNGLKEFYDKDCFLYMARILMHYYKVSKYIDNNREYKKNLRQKFNNTYKTADKSQWSVGRKVLMRICRSFPIFYGAVYLKIKNK